MAEGRELPGGGGSLEGRELPGWGGGGEGREERTAGSFNTMIHELIESVGEGEGGWRYYAHICIKPTVSGAAPPRRPACNRHCQLFV